MQQQQQGHSVTITVRDDSPRDSRDDEPLLEKNEKSKLDAWIGLIAALSYAGFSILITLINKAIFATYNYNYPNVLFLCQMIMSTSFLVIFKKMKLIDYADWNTQTAKRAFVLAFFFIGMVFTGLASLRFVSVIMYSVLRRTTTCFVMLQQYLMLGRVETVPIQVSVFLMVLGAIIAGWADLHGSFIGFAMVIGCCIFTATYNVYVKKLSSSHVDLNIFALMFYNNVLSFPFVALYTMFSGELYVGFYEYDRWNEFGFMLCFLLSGALAFALNYSIFWCTRVNSPLTTTVTGDAKNIIAQLMSIFLFPGDITLTFLYVSGILVSTGGGFLYSYAKLKWK